MRLLRLFIVVLISLAVPFSNVAAAAMAYCAQSQKTSQVMEVASADDTGIHAHHHHASSSQTKVDHHQHGSSDKGQAGCDQCSYCQSCVSAFALPIHSGVPKIKVAGIVKAWATDAPPQAILEQPYRPPRFAFA